MRETLGLIQVHRKKIQTFNIKYYIYFLGNVTLTQFMIVAAKSATCETSHLFLDVVWS